MWSSCGVCKVADDSSKIQLLYGRRRFFSELYSLEYPVISSYFEKNRNRARRKSRMTSVLNVGNTIKVKLGSNDGDKSRFYLAKILRIKKKKDNRTNYDLELEHDRSIFKTNLG